MPDAGYSFLDWDYCLGAIGEFEGGFSRWGSRRRPVGPQDVGQLFRLGIFCVIQLGLDNLE